MERENRKMIVYRCQDSLEGVFTGIYNVYEDRVSPQEAYLSLNREPLLFSQDREVKPDPVKTRKVTRTILRKFGPENFEALCLALSSPEEEKGQAVLQTVAKGLERGVCRGHLLDNLADQNVNLCHKLARGAGRENCHLRGFVRFEELENQILYARIEPKNNLLTFLMPHFSDRFPGENFAIYDVGRELFGLHPAGKNWYLMQGEEPETAGSAGEEEYARLFRHFCSHIAIAERKNLCLQRNLLPLRFREYMTEFPSETG